MGVLPVANSDAVKRTNEIGMVIPVLESCDITGKDVTGDALLTQRALATSGGAAGTLPFHREGQPTDP